MSKQNQQSQNQIDKVVNFAEHLRKKMVIPSLQLENFLNFQYSQIQQKNILNCCTIQKTYVNKAFKRAFKSMSRSQKANYYSKCVKIILNQLHSVNNKKQVIDQAKQQMNPQRYSFNPKKFEQFTILSKQQGPFKKWVMTQVQIATQLCILRYIQTGQQIDLNHYLLRESNSKNKPSIVLQSTQQVSDHATLRISNYTQSLEQLRNRIQLYIDKALKAKISKLLKGYRSSVSTDYNTTIRGQIKLSEGQIRLKPCQSKKNEESHIPATLRLTQGVETKSMRKIISETSHAKFSLRQAKKIYKKLISREILIALSSFKDFQEISPNVFYNKKQQKTRKVFTFDPDQISYEWLVIQMNCYKVFKKWKSCLFLINLLAQLPLQKTKIYHEINLYKDYNEVDYVFLRHMFEADGINYYIDKSINTEEYGSSSNISRGRIQYCLWRFKKTQKNIQILVQIDVKNLKTKNIAQIASQYIGDPYLLKQVYFQDQRLSSMSFKTVNNANLFLFEDQSQLTGSNFDPNSPFKRKRVTQKLGQKIIGYQQNNKFSQRSNQIESPFNFNSKQSKFPVSFEDQDQNFKLNFESMNHSQTQYFSIDQSAQGQQFFDIKIDDVEREIYSQSSKQLSQKQKLFESQEQSLSSAKRYSQSAQNICSLSSKDFDGDDKKQNYLNFRHILKPLAKSQYANLKKSKPQGSHFLWRDQWIINEKGELISVNEELIKAQSGVLKTVIKKIGRNLLAGKSIFNISLPIQIFATDSNLERLCKSMVYAPKFLQNAAKQISPLQRMKSTICFAIGYSINYIQMEKPFNPILGQTYQGMIDGCPLYGQQTSHHPPISTIFFQGRGYFVYANLQAKVQMGMNTVSGINEGQINVSFSNQNLKQKLIKFTCPPGEMGGLIYGDRKITMTRKSYFIDQENMILTIIQWGSQKKKNQISFNNDYFEGKIVKLKQNVDLKRLDKIKQSHYQKVLSQLKGRWTGHVFFDDQVYFNIQKQAPFQVQQYRYPLLSNVHTREDIILRKQGKLPEAQQAKQMLQQIQRNDRKLRKKYDKNH